MSRTQHIRRLAGVVAGLAGALLVFAAAAPAAVASQLRPDPPWWLTHRALPGHPPLPREHVTGPVPVYQVPARTAATGGLPGWQIALIAAAAALAAASVMVLPDRAGRPPDGAHRRRLSEAPAQLTRAISRPAGQKPRVHGRHHTGRIGTSPEPNSWTAPMCPGPRSSCRQPTGPERRTG